MAPFNLLKVSIDRDIMTKANKIEPICYLNLPQHNNSIDSTVLISLVITY